MNILNPTFLFHPYFKNTVTIEKKKEKSYLQKKDIVPTSPVGDDSDLHNF